MGLHELRILRRQGGVPKHVNLWTGRGTIIVYAYNIESPLARRWALPEKFSRHLRDFPAFVAIHSRHGSLHIDRRTGLNFYETKDIAVPADQVNLAPAARRAKIARHNRVSQLSEMEVRLFLSTSPD